MGLSVVVLLPYQLRAHLLQRPWDRCELLPAAVGTEHFWHTHSFPLKVTRSPGGKGSLKQENALQARTACCPPRSPIPPPRDLTDSGLSIQTWPRCDLRLLIGT